MYDYDIGTLFDTTSPDQPVPFTNPADEPPIVLPPFVVTPDPTDTIDLSAFPPATIPDAPDNSQPQPQPDNWSHVYSEGDWQATSDWSPDPATIPQNQHFTQTRNVWRHVDDFWRNDRTGEIRNDSSHDESSTQTQDAIGTQLPAVPAVDPWQHVYSVGPWIPNGDWTPDPATVPQGQLFTQGRTSSRTVTDYWKNTITGEIRDDHSHTETLNEAQRVVGTQLPPVAAIDPWQHVYSVGDWHPTSDWAPDPVTIPQGKMFTQTRTTARQITDYWVNTLTGDTRDDNSHTETSTESQQAIGTQLPPVAAVDPWSHIFSVGDWKPVSDWSPDPVTVPQGKPFTQTRTTQRQVTDYWVNAITGEIRDDNSHTETSSESRQAIGTQLPPVKAVDPWSHIFSVGDWQPVSDWSPDPVTVPQGKPFTQTRTTQRQVTDYWLNAITGEIRDDNSHTETSSESQQAIGTQLPEVKVSLTHHYREGPWTPTGDWAPDTSTIEQGKHFVQTRPTQREIEDYWIDDATGQIDLTSPYNSHTEYSSESRDAIGTQLEAVKVSLTHHYREGPWIPTSDWAPDPSTIPQGQMFTQSRSLQREIEDYWIDDDTGEIDPTSPNNSRTEDSSESRPSIGMQPIAPPPENWQHVYSADPWSPLTDWLPDPANVPKGTQFDQTRSMARHVTDYWQEQNTGAIRDDNSHNETRTDSRTTMGTMPLPLPVKPTGGTVSPVTPMTAGGSSNWWWLLLLAALALSQVDNKRRKESI